MLIITMLIPFHPKSASQYQLTYFTDRVYVINRPISRVVIGR